MRDIIYTKNISKLKVCEVAQQTPRAVTADPPSLLIFPPLIAETFVIEPGVTVLTVNLAGSGVDGGAGLSDFEQDGHICNIRFSDSCL